jgi:hypothetical protein
LKTGRLMAVESADGSPAGSMRASFVMISDTAKEPVDNWSQVVKCILVNGKTTSGMELGV